MSKAKSHHRLQCFFPVALNPFIRTTKAALYSWLIPTYITALCACTSPTMESSAKTDGGFITKLIALHGNFDINDPGSSDSEPNGGSVDGNNGTLGGRANEARMKRSRRGSPKNNVDALKSRLAPPASDKAAAAVDVVPLSDALVAKTEINPIELNVSQQVPSWTQNEREMKRERRKQSNRESARRSRLRKQAEAEELANKVHALTCDNLTLKAEMKKLMESSAKLKLQNAALMERLQGSPHPGLTDSNQRVKPVATMNLLARVNNSDDRDTDDEKGAVVYESRSPAKLHQLLDGNSLRGDAVAAT